MDLIKNWQEQQNSKKQEEKIRRLQIRKKNYN